MEGMGKLLNIMCIVFVLELGVDITRGEEEDRIKGRKGPEEKRREFGMGGEEGSRKLGI